MGTCSHFLPSTGEAVRRFPGARSCVSLCLCHDLCTLCPRADRPPAGRFTAKSGAEGSQKTAPSPSAALAQGHLSLSPTAKRRQLGRANVFVFPSISSPQIGICAWVAPKDTEIRSRNCFISQTWKSMERQGMFLFCGQILFFATKASFKKCKSRLFYRAWPVKQQCGRCRAQGTI